MRIPRDMGPQQCCGLVKTTKWPYIERCTADAVTRTQLDDFFCADCDAKAVNIDGTPVFQEAGVVILELNPELFEIQKGRSTVAMRKTFKGAMRLAHRLVKEAEAA